MVGTSDDQVAVAPGALRRTWLENGPTLLPLRHRCAYHQRVRDLLGPLRSARNDLAEHIDARAVTIRVFHHPGTHRERRTAWCRAFRPHSTTTRPVRSLPIRHLTFVERAGNGAECTPIRAWSPSRKAARSGSRLADAGDLDFPFAVVAHEMAHQWTVPYAAVEGAPVMSESIAWYYGMKAVEHAKGRAQLDQLRRFMRQPHPFPPIRRGEPLLRGLDGYMSYRRGPFALSCAQRIRRCRRRQRRAAAAARGTPTGRGATGDDAMTSYSELQAVTPAADAGPAARPVRSQYVLGPRDRTRRRRTRPGGRLAGHRSTSTRGSRLRRGRALEPRCRWTTSWRSAFSPARRALHANASHCGPATRPSPSRACASRTAPASTPRFLLIDTEHDDNVRAITDR